MKALIKGIPFVLLLVLVPFFFYNDPSIAQAIIVSAVSALCGYRYHLMEKEQVNYALLFSQDVIALKKEINELKDRQAELAYGKKVNFKKDENFVW